MNPEKGESQRSVASAENFSELFEIIKENYSKDDAKKIISDIEQAISYEKKASNFDKERGVGTMLEELRNEELMEKIDSDELIKKVQQLMENEESK